MIQDDKPFVQTSLFKIGSIFSLSFVILLSLKDTTVGFIIPIVSLVVLLSGLILVILLFHKFKHFMLKF